MRNSVYMLTAIGLATWMMALTGTVHADDSIGVCAEPPSAVLDLAGGLLNPTLSAQGLPTIPTDDQDPTHLHDGDTYVGFDLAGLFDGTPVTNGTLGAFMVFVDPDAVTDGPGDPAEPGWDNGVVSVYNPGNGSGSTQAAENACCEESHQANGCFAPVQ